MHVCNRENEKKEARFAPAYLTLFAHTLNFPSAICPLDFRGGIRYHIHTNF